MPTVSGSCLPLAWASLRTCLHSWSLLSELTSHPTGRVKCLKHTWLTVPYLKHSSAFLHLQHKVQTPQLAHGFQDPDLRPPPPTLRAGPPLLRPCPTPPAPASGESTGCLTHAVVCVHVTPSSLQPPPSMKCTFSTAPRWSSLLLPPSALSASSPD